MPAAHAIAEQAIALADGLTAGNSDGDTSIAVSKLASASDRQTLVQARDDLVKRIYLRSDDFKATSALTLVNKAIAAAGWEDPFTWKHRRKP